ncbi:hypothetical protein ACH4MN_36640 [Streptomyces anulatus]
MGVAVGDAGDDGGGDCLRDDLAVADRPAAADHLAHLARMKKPRSVEFVATLPHNPNGKIDRRAIRDCYWAGAERRVN